MVLIKKIMQFFCRSISKVFLVISFLLFHGFIFAQEGSIDKNFNGDALDFGHGPDQQLTAILRLHDGKVIIGGFFNEYNGIPRKGAAMLNPNGSLDHSFNVTSFIGNVMALAQQDDGLILIGGSRNPVTQHLLLRVQKDGSLDPNFNIADSDNGIINDVAIQPDGKILAVGTFIHYDRILSRRIVRLNPDGSRDEDFDIGAGANNTINVVRLLQDGKILIGGTFTQFDGVSINRLARLNQDGSLDETFQTGTGPSGAVNDIQILEDGEILVGGNISNYNGQQVTGSGIIKINPDGTLDDSFGFTNNFFYQIRKMRVREDGKIFVALQASNNNANGFALLKSDGSLDSDFSLPIPRNSVSAIELLENDDLLIGGTFT